MPHFVSIVSRAKRATLISGLAGIRPMSTVKESPLHASEEDTRKWMHGQHSGKSRDTMGTSYDKCAAGFKFRFPSFSGVRTGVSNFAQSLPGKAQAAYAGAKQRVQPAMQAVQPAVQKAQQFGSTAANWVGKNPEIAAASTLAVGTGAYGAANNIGSMFNKHVVAPMAERHVVDALGGEAQVRSMLDAVGAPLAPDQPLNAEALQNGMSKLKEMQSGNWLAPVAKWWNSMDPKMQQQLMLGAGGLIGGGLLGGWQGAAAGALGGAVAPYAWPHAQQWLQQQGYMQPVAHN